MAMSNLPEADFTSALSKSPKPLVSAMYLALAAVLVGVAMTRERLRRTA